MKRSFARVLAAIALTATILVAWAFWWEPRRLAVRETAVELPCWRAAPLRIAVVSDLHVGSPYNGLEKLELIVSSINAGRPDIVVLLGDFVIQGVVGGRFVPPEAIAEKLGALRAPLGVYAVLGNHDWWLDAPRVTKALQSGGIQVLEDSAMSIAQGADHFWLVGISDFMEGKHDVALALSGVTNGDPVMAITHNPDVFPSLSARICLTLAGHTHGGQVALPWIGRPIVPSRHGQRYGFGFVREQGRLLFVTGGVGTSIIPVRFRVAPEIVFLNVRGTQRNLRR